MGSFIWKMKDDLVLIFKMEDSPNFLEVKLNIFFKWKTTSNIFETGIPPQISLKMEYDLKFFENSNIFENEKRPQIFF